MVEGPLPPFEGSVVHGDLAIGSKDVPRFDFDGDDEVVEEGKGEVKSAQCRVSSFCVDIASNGICGTE